MNDLAALIGNRGDGGPDASWPNHERSRFVEAAGLRWHVQSVGDGPLLLLLHGTGAATHSWRDLMPLLAQRFRVVAPDLPAHGFTQSPPFYRLTLPGMAASLAGLLESLGERPLLAAGHSAGAAILVRMVLDGTIEPRGLISFNGAFRGFGGLARHLFPPMAKLLFANPLVPRLFARRAADRAAVKRLIESTGSRLDEQGIALYQRLLCDPAHVRGALGMMAGWNLEPLERAMRDLETPLLLVVGNEDRAVPPSDADRLEATLACARVARIAGAGHLAHEERPEEAARLIEDFAKETGVL